ncbi:MAG TPA: phosphotriesterase [Acidobacteriota bacterium]|nr:phosphotriesterase [Acidobacteriota bacterium]
MRKANRREFLRFAAGLLPLCADAAPRPVRSTGRIQTALGPVSPGDLGVTLMHEHVLVDFIGADRIRPDRYDRNEVFSTVLPYLKKIRELGCRTVVECTPAYLGRDPLLLKQLSEAGRIQLITNTGYYGAVDHKYLPAHAFSESAERLARRWIEESEKGIENTGIRPGIIKIGVNKGPLSEIDRKLALAAALTHRACGLTIASHTGDGAAALEQIRILRDQGVRASAFIWVHAQNESNPDIHLSAAREGASLEFEGFGSASADRQAAQLKSLIDHGHLARLLISLDAGWYHVGEPGGGQFRGYQLFFTELLPALRKAAISEAHIRRLTVDNPREALVPRVRLL